MVVLALDTATHALAAAVGTDGDPVASAAVHVARGHSRLLQPTAAALLSAAGIRPGDLSAVCTGVGPGSYTGVRIAVATAKAMAVALSVPLFTVSTLAALAEAAAVGERGATAVMPLLYARRGRAFGAVYARAGFTAREGPAHGPGADSADPADRANSADPAGRANSLDPADLAGRENSANPADFPANPGPAPWATFLAPQVRPLSAWAGVQTGLLRSGRRLVVVHDFAEQRPGAWQELTSWLDELSRPADAVLALRDVSARLGPALLRLAASGQAQMHEGDAVHRVTPEYALAVEAQVKLAERSGPHGNR